MLFNIFDILRKYSDENHRLSQKEIEERLLKNYDIKIVLPTIFQDNSELNYHNLEGVHNGSEVMSIFTQIQYMEPVEQNRTRHNLLKYCELDIYVMAKE